MLPYILTPDALTVFVQDSSLTFSKSHPHYNEALAAWKEGDEEELLHYHNVSDNVQASLSKSGDTVSIKNGVVYYYDTPVHNTLTTRILEFYDEGIRYDPLIKMLENFMENPSYTSVEQGYRFLEHKYLPVTEDGYFYAYKSVTHDYKDWYSSTKDNSIGKYVQEPRNQVEDNPDVGCSKGLHVGSIGYVSTFHPDGKIIIVKVHPKDIVSVPKDSNEQKMRVCAYLVVADYKGKLEKPCYNSSDPDGENDEDTYCEEDGDLY